MKYNRPKGRSKPSFNMLQLIKRIHTKWNREIYSGHSPPEVGGGNFSKNWKTRKNLKESLIIVRKKGKNFWKGWGGIFLAGQYTYPWNEIYSTWRKEWSMCWSRILSGWARASPLFLLRRSATSSAFFPILSAAKCPALCRTPWTITIFWNMKDPRLNFKVNYSTGTVQSSSSALVVQLQYKYITGYITG